MQWRKLLPLRSGGGLFFKGRKYTAGSPTLNFQLDTMDNLMGKIASLAKRRGFVFPGSEIYGGLAGTWDYGPLGVELRHNVKDLWWRAFVGGRDDVFGIASAILMNARVWEASEHVKNFADPMVDCRKCKSRFRADALREGVPCPECSANDFTPARPFNMLFRTHVGPVEDTAAETYLRPETAQGMFTNFKNVLDTMHPRLPFGMAQIGKAFRNEITPSDFIFRSREFEQMEIEYFVREEEWEKHFAHWLEEMKRWISALGISEKRVHYQEIPEGERAHYSKRTVDIEYDFPFGRKELYGLAYRGDFDLKNHMAASGQDLNYTDPVTGEKFLPHVIEPTWGVDRSVLVSLLEAYREEEDKNGTRVFLKLPVKLAPHTAAVFPLVANKPQLRERAQEIYSALKSEFSVAWDDRGNIGKRYYAQDEIGTPWCITVDYQTLEDDSVTVRDRDTTKQERVSVPELAEYFREKLS